MFSGRLAQPLENARFNVRKLRGAKRAQLPNSADCRISGNALRDEGAVFEKWNVHLDFKLRVAKRGAVENDRDHGTVGIGKRNTEDENGPDFSQSNNQTSPRLGTTFLLVVHRRQLVARSGGYVIA